MIELAEARKVGGHVLRAIEPWVDRAKVVGSVRRRRPQVNDVDIVVQPKAIWLDMMEGALLRAGVQVRHLRRAPKSWMLEWQGVKVEMYLTVPERYAMMVLWRTGSARHNKALAIRARQRGLRIRMQGVMDAEGGRVAWRSEREVFEALGLVYVPPERRF